MDERRDPDPGDGSRPRPPIVAAVRLSPMQEAWGDYTRHTLICPACRDVDRTCDESSRLYRAWRERADDAARRLRGETA